MEDGWEDEWSFDDEEEEIDAEISKPTNDKTGIEKTDRYVEGYPSQGKGKHEGVKTTTLKVSEPSSPSFENFEDCTNSLHSKTKSEKGLSQPQPTHDGRSDECADHTRRGEPVLQVLRTYLMDQLQSYSLQFTTDQLTLRDECNRRFLDAFSSKSTLEELARYYSSPKQESLFLYTLQKEVPRMEYRVIVEDFSKSRGRGGPSTKTLVRSVDIQSHFLVKKLGKKDNDDVSPTVATSGLEHLILRSANQSLLADALAMLTSPDGLVRPQYFTTARATDVRFVVDTIRGSVNCQSTLEISIPSVSASSKQSDKDGCGNRVAIATVVLNMLYIPPYSPTGPEFLKRPDLETRVPRLECHIVDICPAPLLKSSPEEFLRVLKQAANSLADMWLEMGHTEPALEEMLGNVAKGHALLVKQKEHAPSALLDFTTVHSLREALLSNSNYSQANAALVQAASKGSTGFASAWQQLDSATGLGSKVKFLSNVTFLPSADVLALENNEEEDEAGNFHNASELGMFPRPPPWKGNASKGMFPRTLVEVAESGQSDKRNMFPRPPVAGHQAEQRGVFPRPPVANHQAEKRGMFPRPSVAEHQAEQRGMFPRPPAADIQAEQRGMFPRPPVAEHQAEQRGMFPRPPAANIQAEQSGMFPRPPAADIQAEQRDTFPRPPVAEHQAQQRGLLPRPPLEQSSSSQTGLFPRPPEAQGLFPKPAADHGSDSVPVREFSKGQQMPQIRVGTQRSALHAASKDQSSGQTQCFQAPNSHMSSSSDTFNPPTKQAVQSQNAPIIGGLLMSGLSRVARSIAPPAPSPYDALGTKLYNRSTNPVVADSTSSGQFTKRKDAAPLAEGVLNDNELNFDEDCKIEENLLRTEAEGRTHWLSCDDPKINPDDDNDGDGPNVLPPAFRKGVEVLAERLSHGENWRDIRDGTTPSITSSCSSEWELVQMPKFDEPVWRRLLDKEDILDDGFGSGNHPPNEQETRQRWITSREFLASTFDSGGKGTESYRSRLWVDK